MSNEPNQTPTPNPTPNEPAPESSPGKTVVNDDFFTKLDSILDKRLDGVAKSALKANGVSEDELQEVLTQYRQQKQAKESETVKTLNILQAENEKLKSSAAQIQVESAAFKEALELGIDKAAIPYVLRLGDLSKVVGEKGELKTDAIKESLNKVLEDVPALKGGVTSGKGFKVGADGKPTNSDATKELLTNIFGKRKE
ncbi:MAG: hypothetical protein RR219_05155 [Clostridiales bacterium]